MMRASAAVFTASGLNSRLQFRLSKLNSNPLEAPCHDVQQAGRRAVPGAAGGAGAWRFLV
jgi:hypothetical protein